MKLAPKSRASRGLAALALAGGIITAADTALACNNDSYLGTICYFAFDYCPEGTLPAAGQLLPVSQNAALYSLLGYRFGGSPPNTFALPDLRGRVPVAVNPTGANDLSRIGLGDRRGQETATLTVGNLPAHEHAVTALHGNVEVGTGKPGEATPILNPGQTAYLANATILGSGTLAGLYTTTDPTQGSAAKIPVTVSGTTAATGGGQAVPIAPPALGLTACIVVTNGMYPMRP